MARIQHIARRACGLHRGIDAASRLAGGALVALVIAGCGGGSGTPSAEPAATTAANPLAAATDAQASADGTTTKIADEGQNFSVSGTQTVRYGSGSSWITRTVSGGGECTNAWFGNDPLFGVVKQCELVGSDWTGIAVEGASFTVSGTQTVRYGSGTQWIVRTVSGGGVCSNDAFGGDPLYGVVKVCEVAGAGSAVAGWTRIAGEGQTFSVSGTQTVRYGSGAQWIQKSVTNGGYCTNAYFGSDPSYGVVKECDVAAAGAVTTPVAGVCTPPVGAVDTSATAPRVGNGTAASCTEEGLRAAVASGGIVRFDCGADPVTIRVGAPISVPTDRDTVIDGGAKVTLDGGGTNRILSLMRGDYRTNSRGLTLQRITLANGRAPGTGFVPQDPNRLQCAWGYAGGAGGAIEVRDARLHVIDVEFRNNAAATPGQPDESAPGPTYSTPFATLPSNTLLTKRPLLCSRPTAPAFEPELPVKREPTTVTSSEPIA